MIWQDCCCANRDCERIARWRPILLLRCHTQGAPARWFSRYGVCDEHRSEYMHALLMDNGHWEHILGSFRMQRLPLPDRTLTKIEWVAVPIGEG